MKNRVKTSTVLQMEATECGAAALAIVLAYYDKYISLEDMRIDCGVSRDGCNAINMLQAARKHGMVAEAVQIDNIDEIKEIKAPAILFWEFNHFVVFEEFNNDTYYINDPAVGPRKVSRQDFDRAFTGIALLIRPDTNFIKSGTAPSLLNAVQKRLAGAKSEISFVIFASLALVVPNIVLIGLTKVFIDNLLIDKIVSWQVPFFTIFVLTVIVLGLLTWLEAYYLLRIRIKLLLIGSMTFLWRVLSLPVNFFEQRYTGDIIERVSANDRISNLLSAELSSSLVGFLTMGIYAVIMLLLNVPLAIISFILISINFFLYKKISRRFADISRNFLQQNGKLLGIEMNGLSLIEDLKANGRENDFFQRWAGVHAETISLQQKQALFSIILTIIPSFITSISILIILGLGSLQIINGAMTIGTLVAFQILYNVFSAPIRTLLQVGGDLQKIKGDLTRLDDIYNADVDTRLFIESNKPMLNSSIHVKDVEFSYTVNKKMLTDINLTVEPGTMVAITGKTGEGKSTIAKLIAGLYQPQKGSISIGDIALTQIDAETLATNLSYVDQDFFIYTGTIKEDITFWDEKISDEEVTAALKDVDLYDLILSRGGLSARVQENGSNFSGGQRQRIEIARAIAQKPAILILDEATSNLDANIELKILKNILNKKMTVLMITHREETLVLCDKVYHLENGVLQLIKGQKN